MYSNSFRVIWESGSEKFEESYDDNYLDDKCLKEYINNHSAYSADLNLAPKICQKAESEDSEG